MQKCSSSADKKIEKNKNKKSSKTVLCDGFSCKVINDNKNLKSSKNIMIDLDIK